jgi:hypothetical protein
MTSKNDNSHYQGALLEEIRDEIKAVHESVAPMPTLCRDVSQLKDDVSQLKTDVATIKAVVTDQSSQLKDHEKRVTTLER